MSRVKFGDVVKDVKINIDRLIIRMNTMLQAIIWIRRI